MDNVFGNGEILSTEKAELYRDVLLCSFNVPATKVNKLFLGLGLP